MSVQTRPSTLLFFAVLIALVFYCALFSGLAHAKDVTDEDCLDCHGIASYATPIGKHGNGEMRSLGLNVEALRDSVHGKLKCVNCHDDIKESPHKRESFHAVDCVSCHEKLEFKKSNKINRLDRRKDELETVINTKYYANSIHAKESEKINAGCATCHTAHYVYVSTDPRATTYRERSPEMCGECHEKAMASYSKSLHMAALKRPWKGKSATCSDCHSSHQIEKSKNLLTHRVITEGCGNCHEDYVNSYMMTTHGQLAWLGDKKVPKCVSCHRAHDTRKAKDSFSKVSDKNILKTCRKCHKKADASIVQYHSHASTSNFDKYPYMWIAGKLLIFVIVMVLIFFYSHSMLWFYREYKERAIRWQTYGFISTKTREKKQKKVSEQYFQRFSWVWRVNHWCLALSVMTLVFTGMAVMYPDTTWAMAIVNLTGGPAAFGMIHRIVGVFFLVVTTTHVIAVLVKVVSNKKFQWFGPNSLLPRLKDWHDIKQQYMWFFNKGPQPQFDRWTYWEKFDYWAVYWGTFVIGTSGLILWYSDVLIDFVPGWIFNIAALAHGLEAFLAVMTLFVVHFFNNHFRPAKFPLDTVMFTGRWGIEELKEERPLHYKRLQESGELDKYIVEPPSKAFNILAHVLGFSLLGIGIILLILVMTGFNQRGFA